MNKIKIAFLPLFALLWLSTSEIVTAQSSGGSKDEIIALEKKFADAIKSRDSVQTSQLQSESYFLAIGIEGMPIQNIPKLQWLSTLKFYVTESYSMDDIKVSVYGNTAVAMIMFTQKATVRGQDRSAQFLITDIWNKEQAG